MLVASVRPAAAQVTFPPGTVALPSHVIVDSCSGCGGAAGPIAIDQTTPGTTNGVVVNNVPHIVCDSGCGSPPATADGSAFAFGTTSVSPIGAVVDDVATTTVSENSFGAPRMSGSRLLYVDLGKTTANATAIKVDGSAVTQPVSGSFFQTTQPVSGTFWQTTQPVSLTSTTVTGNVTAVQATGTNLHVVADTGSTTAVTALPALVAGSAVIGHVIVDTAPTTAVTLATAPALVASSAVIGHVIADASAAVIGHVVADTGSTTAVTGNVTVTQATGTNLHTVCDSGCGGAAAFLDNAAFTAGTTPVGNIGAVFNDGLVAVTSGNAAAPRITNTRGLHVNLRSAAGAELPLPAALAANGGLKIEGVASGVAVPVSFTQPALVAGSAVIGHVIVDTTSTSAVTQATGTNLHAVLDTTSTTAVTQATGTNLHAVLDTTSTTAVTQATAANLNATVTPIALTKGTQSATGFSTQDLKDAGRTTVTLTADAVTPILTTDTIITFAKLVGDTVTTAQTTYQVTSGKTLRLTGITIGMAPTSTTPAALRVRLRTLSSGACIVATGLVVGVWAVTSPIAVPAIAGGGAQLSVPFPDGLEFSGATRNICLSGQVLGAASQAVTITVTGYEY